MEIAEYLANLKARRAQLDSLITQIEADLAMGQAEGVGTAEVVLNGLASGGPAPAIHADTFFGLSIIDAAKKYLKMAGRAQHASEIADALAKGGLKRPDDRTLSSILIRAAKGREIMKVGKATWGLAAWYPKPPKDAVERKPHTKRGRKHGAVKVLALPAHISTPANGAGASNVILEVLRAAGKPLHVRAITQETTARGKNSTEATVRGLLAALVKKGKAKRTAPATFAI